MTPSSTGSEQDDNDEMLKYGISRVPVDYFHYKDFRYTALKDAVAEARRRAALQDRHERTDVAAR